MIFFYKILVTVINNVLNAYIVSTMHTKIDIFNSSVENVGLLDSARVNIVNKQNLLK